MDPLVETGTGSLKEALCLGKRAHVALVGAGGKTTLMSILFEELTAAGIITAASTTTKVHIDEARGFPCVVLTDEEPDPDSALSRCLERYGSVFVGRGLLSSGKMDGISPEEADRLFSGGKVSCLIVEADGASRMPLKAPAEHEPVVASSATHVIALLGCEAIGMPLNPKRVFRHERVAALTGLKTGERMTPEALSRLFTHRLGPFKAAPEGALRIVFVNKTDLAADQGPARRLSSLLLSEGSIERVVLGSLRNRCYNVIYRRGR